MNQVLTRFLKLLIIIKKPLKIRYLKKYLSYYPCFYSSFLRLLRGSSRGWFAFDMVLWSAPHQYHKGIDDWINQGIQPISNMMECCS